MQLAGSRFTDATAAIGNDLATLPNFPAEIRAPAGTLAGVSAFQIHFASRDILTPGGRPNALVAMNPAALKMNLPELEGGGILIVNEDGFTKSTLLKAQYESSPLEDGTLDDYQGFRVPITPASELLHELSRHKRFGVRTVQAEDEIAASNMALGAAFGGHLGVTVTSGPGMDLKAETIGLAVALELPLLVIDVQRAGPSTGMPTKTEAADLLMAIHGRHGESPLPVVAAATPAQCFEAVFESVRIAVRYRTPVILLSDTFLANSSEPWRLPGAADLPRIDPGFATEPNHDGGFRPSLRDESLARLWAPPGTKGFQHVVGGLEKEDETGHISYEAENHARMTRLRAEKIAGIASDNRELAVDHEEGAGLE